MALKFDSLAFIPMFSHALLGKSCWNVLGLLLR